MTVEWNGISVLMSLNNLSPLVANFKISYMNTAYALQEQHSQISVHLDLGTLSAISVLQSLSELSPLVANYNINYLNSG